MVSATRALEGFAQQVRDSSSRQEKAALSAESAAQSNARAAGALEGLPAQLGNMTGSLAQTASTLKETAKQAADKYKQTAEQQRQFLQGLSEGLGKFADRIRQVLQIYGDDVQSQTRERIQQFAVETAGILTKLETLQNELGENVESVQAVASRLRSGGTR